MAAQLPQRHELTRTCRHLHFLTAAIQGNELNELYFKAVAGIAHCFQACLDASDVAVVV